MSRPLVVSAIAPVDAGESMPHPPDQPETGPGGSVYQYDEIDATRAGTSPEGTWVFAPAGVAAADLQARPVVVVPHGFTTINRRTYGGWIEHLLRRGAMVIYPGFQDAGLPLEMGAWSDGVPVIRPRPAT